MAEDLQRALKRAEWPQRPKGLFQWCQARVGTVHRFQGKEEGTVFMVLGADPRQEGAVEWAARKPNLLNVALTRAQHRFFMVGDRSLWGRFPYFSEAADALPRVEAAEFLALVRRSAPAPVPDAPREVPLPGFGTEDPTGEEGLR